MHGGKARIPGYGVYKYFDSHGASLYGEYEFAGPALETYLVEK